jgi:hypothetical protein
MLSILPKSARSHLFAVFALSFAISLRAETPYTRKPPVKHRPIQKHVNADLEMAKVYLRLRDWSEAEQHFVSATKDPISEPEALLGLEAARREADNERRVGIAAPLGVAKLYEKNDIEPKAEEIYRSTATNSSAPEDVRKSAADELATSIKAQEWDRRYAWLKEWTERVKGGVEFGFWALVVLIGVFLARAIWNTLSRRRKAILFHDFSTPSDETSRGLAILFKQARARMQNPSLSPVTVMSPVLIRNLPTFSDEVEPIEDLELGGAKIPFAAIAKVWGEPKIQISGGFDGLSPLGGIFAVIKRRDDNQPIYWEQVVRTGVPSQQRSDLFDFAYDVIIRSSTAYDA